MGQQLNIQIKGLFTADSDISSVPPGSLYVADNVIIDRENVAEPRRGFDYLKHGSPSVKSSFSNIAYRPNKIFFYGNKILSQYSTARFGYHDDTSGWVETSTSISPPSETVPCRSAQANQNLYVTTSNGVYKIDSYSATPKLLGCPAGLDTKASVAVAPSSTWLTNNHRTAYRIVWGIKDANNNLILGAPSQREALTNTTGATCSVQLVFTVPATVTTAHFYQVYRAASVDNTTTVVEPSDEMGLVYEGNPTSGDISNGYVTVVDLTPDTLRGATIYTAQSQEGIANANYPPPLAQDLSVFRNCLFYGNTQTVQQYNLTLLGTGSPNGVQVGDTLTINGITFTAASSENIASRQFKVSTVFTLTTTGTISNGSTSMTSVANTTGLETGQLITGSNIPSGTYITNIAGSTVTMSLPATANATGQSVTFTGLSASQAIRETSLSLVRVINRYSSSTLYAYYMSGTTDLPGKLLIQARTLSAAKFYATSSRAACWSPALPTSGTTQASTNDQLKNGLFFSKSSQPEAVPLANYLLVGSADKNILRVLALRDSLFVLKEDGAFRVYGTDPSNFQVVLLDNTSNIIAPETAVTLNNQIYALTSQGVVAVSETGASIVSNPIENLLTDLTAVNYATLQQKSFGVAYESQRTYYLWVIESAADTYPTQYFRYNYINSVWTRGTLPKLCGGVNPTDDKLYLGNVGEAIIDVERKKLNFTDYADYSSTQTISAVDGTKVTISAADTVQVGGIIYQSDSVFGEVVAVDAVGGTVTTSLPIGFSLASADVLNPINASIEWVPATLGNPAMSKHIREAAFLFQSDFNGTATVGFSTDVSPDILYETLQGMQSGGWGMFAWGGPSETPLGALWGGDNRRRPVRVLIPRNHQRCSLLNITFSHSIGFAPWLLQGVSIIGEGIGERVGQ